MRFLGCDGTLDVVIGAEVLKAFGQHQQLYWWQRERGGLLFASSVGQADGKVEIVETTGPNPRDKSGRTWLKLDHKRCLDEIAQRFKDGLHFVGYWHTHAEAMPKLSNQDMESIAPLVTDPGVDLLRILMVVVGGRRNTIALDVSVLDRRTGKVSALEPPSPMRPAHTSTKNN